jgi:DNA ligase 1
MIKDPNSAYEGKRSKKLLKVKVFQDAEAKVLAIEKGQGRLANLMGKILVKDIKSGVEFRIGTGFDDAKRKSPPKIGTIVTYKFQNLTDAGIPRFPVYMRDHPGM